MFALLISVILVIIAIVLIVCAVCKKTTGYKAAAGVYSVFCVLILIVAWSGEALFFPSAIKGQIRNKDIEIPQYMYDAVNDAEIIVFSEDDDNGLRAKLAKIDSKCYGDYGNEIKTDFYIRGYRFENEETAKKLTLKLMTDTDMGCRKMSSSRYTDAYRNWTETQETISGWYNRGTPEETPYWYTYLRETPSFWAKTIKKQDDLTVYSTPTALTVTNDAESAAFIGRYPGTGYRITVFAIQKGPYVFVFTEDSYMPYMTKRSYFSEWLDKAQSFEYEGRQ